MIQLKGRITQKQSITGTVKNPSHVHGIISKPSYEHGKSDHVFVIVDLLKLYANQTTVIHANTALNITAANTPIQDGVQLQISVPSTTLSLENATITEFQEVL